MSVSKEDFDKIFDLIKSKSDYLELYKESIYEEAKEKNLIEENNEE